MYHAIIKTTAHLPTGEQHQREGLSSNDGDIHLRKPTTYYQRSTCCDSATHLADVWVQQQHKRQHTAQQDLAKPEQGCVQATFEQEEAFEEIEIGYTGEALDIGFNVTYLLDVLANLSSDKVTCSFGDANSSVLITISEDADFRYVVMPMRI